MNETSQAQGEKWPQRTAIRRSFETSAQQEAPPRERPEPAHAQTTCALGRALKHREALKMIRER
jgi:hypothetical protein